jgi:hypothetical protein
VPAVQAYRGEVSPAVVMGRLARVARSSLAGRDVAEEPGQRLVDDRQGAYGQQRRQTCCLTGSGDAHGRSIGWGECTQNQCVLAGEFAVENRS